VRLIAVVTTAILAAAGVTACGDDGGKDADEG
jgi:hypothetical protein